MIAAIPSPSFNSIGPFTLYGLMIALGVAAAATLAHRRWMARGGGEDDISTLAMWGVLGGVIGARIYHIITDFQFFRGESFWKLFAIWEGGLGIPGGMLLGVLVGLRVAKMRGIDVPGALDAVVPGLPLAQAIGRWGNWFNQELYGKPTDAPWGLTIDGSHRGSIPVEYQDVDAFPTFHPTFLYESLWNFALVGVILWVDRKQILPRGRLIAVYLLGYGIGRAWIEALRIDTVNTIFGLRVNIWMSLALIIGSVVVVLWPRGDDDQVDDTEQSDDDNDSAEEAPADTVDS